MLQNILQLSNSLLSIREYLYNNTHIRLISKSFHLVTNVVLTPVTLKVMKHVADESTILMMQAIESSETSVCFYQTT